MGYNHFKGTDWCQAVCDGCGYIEDTYDGMGDSFSAVEASELGHYLQHWLWTYGDPIDLCPKCSIECPTCYGEGCEDCGCYGRKAIIGVHSREETRPAGSSPLGGNRVTATGDIRFGLAPVIDTTNAAVIELTEPADTVAPRLNLMIADASAIGGIPGLLTSVEAALTPEQAIEVRARIDSWLARLDTAAPAGAPS
ncbi:hypothetical protein [Mycolicibacterium llatzerense]|uniref:hypothetical protein n=1 Tax=Mycolicibacterium llatzerense TaxID=280871 RepID=UPI0021B62B43|nr:hypothetical protein [Mycolicibacterium llatzerense]MCT7371884.1 hypothetical protein [Mycolicibacterium llatzerense]